jgi:HPr kinase/phosphorylase
MYHGVLIQLSGQGILITGDSGIGKTACGLELAGRGGYWIADDAVILEGRGNHLYGRGHRRTRKWVAVRGRGILDARDLLGAETIRGETRVDVMIRFVRGSGKEGTVREEENSSMLDIVGVSLLCRRLEAGDGPQRMSDQVMNAIDGLIPSIARRRVAHDCQKGPADQAGGDRR